MLNKLKIGLGMMFFLGLFFVSNASAKDYDRILSGASWYYYTIDKTDENKYSDDEMLYVPFGKADAEKVAVPAKTCQSYGGFWALLKNGYEEGSNGEAVLSSKPVSATVLSDVYYKDMTWVATGYTSFKEPSAHQSGPQDDNNSGVKATAYGDMGTVLSAYQTLINTSAVPQSAKEGNIGNLSYFCAGSDSSYIPDVTADFVSFSTVSLSDDYTSAPVVNGQGYISEPMVVDGSQKTISVTFRHYLAKNIEHELENAEVSYALNTGGGANVQTGTMVNRFDIYGINYYATAPVEEKVDFNVTAGDDVTYCQAITFNGGSPKSYKLADYKVLDGGKAPASSSACVTIHVIVSSPETVSSCDQGGDGEMIIDKNGNAVAGNSVLGSTIATVGISKNGVLETTTAASRDDTKLIYTKPGDMVQFSYSLCFGAHKVNGASTMGGGGSNSNNHANIFEIHVGPEGKTKREDMQYLFGRADGLLGQPIYVWPNDIYNNKISISSFYYFGSTQSKVPTENGQYITIDNTKKQISLASPDDRGGGSSPYAPVIVGGTLSQTLVYQDLAVWPSYLSKSGSIRGPYNEAVRDYSWGNIKFQGDLKNYLEAFKDYQAGYTSPSGSFIFSEDEIMKTAGAVTPYNFDTNVTSEIANHPSSTVEPGDEIKVTANIDILPRVNPITSDKNGDGQLVPYATATPVDTKVEVIELIIRDRVDINNEEKYSFEDKYGTHKAALKEILNSKTEDTFTNSSICNMYQYYLGSDLGECSSTVVKGNNKMVKDPKLKVVGNPNSNPEGEMGYFNTDNPDEAIERIVPDVEAGYKYCIAVGINHGDSHNLPGKILTEDDAVNEYSASEGTSGSVRTTWKTSKFSCRTVVKEPNFQVWNGGMYADGGVSASTANKTVNTKVSSNLPNGDAEGKYKATKHSTFGSWTEYFIVSKGSIVGLASASALGYRDPYVWYETDKDGNKTEHIDYFAATGFGTGKADFCTLSHLTIANTTCESNKSGGYAAGDTDSSTLEAYKQRILNYYTNKDAKIGNPGVIGGGSFGEFINSGFDYGEQNGAKYLKVLGNFTIDNSIIHNFGEGTLVIEVDGRLTIDGNICLGTGICEQGDSTNWQSSYDQHTNDLSLYWDNDTNPINGNDIANLPQVILIAENIDIGSEVSQIDAWLITSSKDQGYDGGTINTCKEFKNRETGTSTCWKTLKVNGPVVTSNLMLNRTGGAWPGFSGDVGNHAYDYLYKEKEEAVASLVAGATNNPIDPIAIEAAHYCNGSLVPQACLKARIKVVAERVFLDGRSEAEKRAYENSGNFSAEKSTVSVNKSSSRDLTCDGSITPAEIFDLHPIVYYWAVAEAQKGNQAIVTYAQEFAPRY